jgi:hypothetical protein
VNSGRGNKGAGDELGARNDGGDVLGDGDKVDGGLSSIGRRGRSGSRAVVTVVRTLTRLGVTALVGTVAALDGSLRDSSGSGRADGGALDDSLGDDLLSVRSRAVDDRGSTRGDGIDVSLADGAGDHARSIGSGSDSRGRGLLSIRSRASGDSRLVGVGGSSAGREAARLSGNVASRSSISVATSGSGGKVVVGTTSGGRGVAGNDSGVALGSGNDSGETLRARDDSGEASRSGDNGSEVTLRAGENSGVTLGARHNGSETS